MLKVRDFVSSPENILGNADTKHGEIAEHVHVAIRRAKDLLNQRPPSASIDGVPRTGPVDYQDGGRIMQSKFYSKLSDALKAVKSHAERNEGFVSSGGRYHIPKDQYGELKQALESGSSSRSIDHIKGVVEKLEQTTGRPLDDLVEPSELTYDEVQPDRIHETIKDRESSLADRNKELKDQARKEHGPSLSGAATAAALGAAAGGGVSFAQTLWIKYRDGKNPFRGEFSHEDWKGIGLDTAKGAGVGAVSGASLYLATNYTDLAAPFAGALVSGLMGIGTLVALRESGEIDDDQFVDCSLMVASEAAIVGLSAAAGQTLVPIPMLGAFIGSIAGRIVASALRDGLGKAESELIKRLEAYQAEAVEKLDDALRAVMDELNAYFGQLSDLASLAFDETINTELRLAASVQMAAAIQVPDHQILRSKADLDGFMEE